MAKKWIKDLCWFLAFSLFPALSLQKMCPAGFHLSEETQQCAPCVSGVSFTEHINDHPACLACRLCRADQEEQRPCMPWQDTECVCKAGTFHNAEHPELCEKCTGCPKNKREVSACSPWNDTKCGDQPRGHWKAELGPWIGVIALLGFGFLIWLVWRCCCSPKNPAFQNLLKNVLCVRCRRPPEDPEEDPEAVQNALNKLGTDRDLLHREEIEDNSHDTVLGDTVLGDTVLGDTVLGDTVLGDRERAPAGPRQAPERKKRLVPARDINYADTLPRLFCDFLRFMSVSDWKLTMRRLNLSDCEIDQIQKENSDTREQVYRMLMAWLNKEGLGISVNSLLDALDAQGQRLARENIEKILINSNKFMYDDEGADPVALRVEEDQ